MKEKSLEMTSTLDMIKSGLLDADPMMFKMTPEELAYICNGCGAKGKFDFVPDTIWFMSIKEVCNIHDFDYHMGKTIEDKMMADRRMRNNMLRLIVLRSWGWLRRVRRWRVNLYYRVVDAYGGPAFWVGKNIDKWRSK